MTFSRIEIFEFYALYGSAPASVFFSIHRHAILLSLFL